MFKDIANLIYTQIENDDEGCPVETEEKTEVYVEKMSVTRTEFYRAMKLDRKPTAVFKVRLEDFELTKHIVGKKAVYATKLEYDEAIYDIIRDYSPDGAMTELICD